MENWEIVAERKLKWNQVKEEDLVLHFKTRWDTVTAAQRGRDFAASVIGPINGNCAFQPVPAKT